MAAKRSAITLLGLWAARLLIRNDAIRLGRRVRAARERRGMGVVELARRTGLVEADLRRWEGGDPVGFDSFALELIGRGLNRTRSWLLAGEAEPPEDSLAFGEALASERVVAIIGSFEEIPSSATRRRLARYLLFVAVTGLRARAPEHLRHWEGDVRRKR